MTIKRKGFTLMELIIVVAIIAILASAAIIAINPAKNLREARNSTRWSQMNSIANGIYAYVVDQKGQYPTCLFDASTSERIIYDASTTDPWDLVDITTCTELIPVYLPQFPDEPQGQDYVVGFMSEATTSDRIIIRCTAQEAIDENILIVQ